MKAAPDSVNIEVNKGAMNYSIGNKGPSMFSAKINRPAPTAGSTQKRKTARELIFGEMKEYHGKPNPKKLKDLRDKCASSNISFDQLFNKAKEQHIKEKSQKKKDNPSGLEDKLVKRIAFGNKLIENLQAEQDPPPYADSILASARYNKMRILEAHISNYSDSMGVREQRINESDPHTGRVALHYLCYMGNSEMIQLLGATD